MHKTTFKDIQIVSYPTLPFTDLSIKTDPEWALSPKIFTFGCSAVAYGFTVSVCSLIYICGSYHNCWVSLKAH